MKVYPFRFGEEERQTIEFNRRTGLPRRLKLRAAITAVIMGILRQIHGHSDLVLKRLWLRGGKSKHSGLPPPPRTITVCYFEEGGARRRRYKRVFGFQPETPDALDGTVVVLK